MDSIFNALLKIGKVAGALSFIFGIIYGLYQYVENQKAKQVEQTLALFKQYNSAPFTDYRGNISKAVLNNQAKIASAAVDVEQLRTAVVAVVVQEQIGKDLVLIMDFFDGVVVCVIRSICDPDTTQQLFSKRARELFVNFFQYIEVQRKSSSAEDFAIGLETMAAMPPTKPVKSER